jgi:chemotaxis protein methyltransferase CheR
VSEASISDAEFVRFQRLMHDMVGIQLSDAKKPLVSSRLAGRLRARALRSYGDYFELITSGDDAELQMAVDLLTTNETYFFREPKHFEFLSRVCAQDASKGSPFRVWSAASSSGEEAYSVAMLLADRLGDGPWEVFASDLSTRVLAKARVGQFPMARATNVPADYLRRFCLKGIGPQAGTLLVASELQARVRFEQINLAQPLPDIGTFDVIFLRNVMIYFDNATKRSVVARLLSALRPGGYFLIGHSETLQGVNDSLESIAPAIYRKPVRE